MKINISKRDRNFIVEIIGDIDHHSSEEIRDKVDKEFSREQAKNIIFDLSKVTFMDSSGIGMLIGRYKLIENKGGKVVAVNISNELKRIFEISGLKKLIATYDDLETALKEI